MPDTPAKVKVPTDFIRPGSISITYSRRDRLFTCWRPHVSQVATTRKEVLAFARWPASTPTGQALREWLTALLAAPAEAHTFSKAELQAAGLEQAPEALTPELLATGFGPECFAPDDQEIDPTANTRTVI